MNQSASEHTHYSKMLRAWRVLIVVMCLGLKGTFAEKLKAEARDSYLDAYHESRPESQGKKHDRDSKYSPFDEGTPPQFYGPPENDYGPPTPAYGPPVHIYGPPTHGYGGPPSFPSLMPFYGMPHAMLGFFDKIKMKLNVFTILKIILKLVIFKKIISFIALICLLLFIPKFKLSKEETDEDMESRSLPIERRALQGHDHLTTLTERVLSALESYTRVNRTDKCNGEDCTTSTDKVFQNIEDKFSYTRLLDMYGKED